MTSEVSLNVADESVDQRRDHQRQRLRQHDQPGAPPIAEAQRIGRLDLALRDRLQPAAHDFGEIGGGEQDERDLRAQQLVDRHAGRQEQRQHDRGHEQHRDQRHAAHQLDIGDADRAHRRQFRAPAERQQDRRAERRTPSRPRRGSGSAAARSTASSRHRSGRRRRPTSARRPRRARPAQISSSRAAPQPPVAARQRSSRQRSARRQSGRHCSA